MPPARAPAPEESLTHALRDMLLRPHRSLLPAWSWKAAAFSAILRAAYFFRDNLRAGRNEALRAGAIELLYIVFAAGLVGAVSQRLRIARPLWATALFVWLAMPGVLLLAQFFVHRVAKTPHMAGGLIESFCLTAVAASYTWFAMRHGALLGGEDSTSLRDDVRLLPRITLDYLLVLPHWLGGKTKQSVASKK